ncbi:MAG: hypothetical protein ACFFFT_09090 [Candidatus Thorarchaeota archaeon]
MIYKFSSETQKEIDEIIKKIQIWKDLFNIKQEYYIDGWSISLKEKNVYPRCIVIFKSYESNQFDIKSFDVYLRNYKKEEYHEIYSVQKIKNQHDLIKELKQIIYGKDLGSQALQIYNETFSE